MGFTDIGSLDSKLQSLLVMYRFERVILVVLVWGLILEALTLIYFYTSSQTWRFEFQYTLALFLVTVLAVILLIGRVYVKLRRTGGVVLPEIY